MATRINKKDFRVGFEIEGGFNRKLAGKIQSYGDFKHDGSVNVEYEPGDIIYEEFATGIMSYPAALRLLAVFTDRRGYHWDDTCGLHVHVSTRTLPAQDLHRLACNFRGFILPLQTQAVRWCDCLAERLDHNDSFCERYNRSDSLQSGYQCGTKYRFLRFHPSGTLEFRFLAPCEHKVDNVRRLLTLVYQYLNSTQLVRRQNFSLTDEDQSINLDRSLDGITNRIENITL